MDIFNLLFVYTVALTVFYFIYGVVCAIETSIYEVTGRTYSDMWSSFVTWGIQNPMWAWEALDKFFPKEEAIQSRYFL